MVHVRLESDDATTGYPTTWIAQKYLTGDPFPAPPGDAPLPLLSLSLHAFMHYALQRHELLLDSFEGTMRRGLQISNVVHYLHWLRLLQVYLTSRACTSIAARRIRTSTWLCIMRNLFFKIYLDAMATRCISRIMGLMQSTLLVAAITVTWSVVPWSCLRSPLILILSRHHSILSPFLSVRYPRPRPTLN